MMKSKPLVSVVTIFLNAGKFIQEAIESVLAQTYDKWELLLVDDGSTDGSTVIARQYAGRYPEKVRYLEHDGHQNRGMSATRNLGISKAEGEYIAFLDADDVWLPHKLEQQVAILDSNPLAGLVFGPTQYWYSWAGNLDGRQHDSVRAIGVPPDTLYQPPQLLALLLQNQVNAPATCSVLVQRKVFEEVGGFEDIFRGLFEDKAFFAKVYLKVPVYVTGECWDRYRQHPDSCCSVAERTRQFQLSQPNPEHLNFLNWMTGYLSEQGTRDEEVWQALQKGFWPYNHPILYRLSRIKKRLEYIWR